MSQIIEIKVPDIGDYKDVPVIEVHVKVGDQVDAEIEGIGKLSVSIQPSR